jgi:hypothetical protein
MLRYSGMRGKIGHHVLWRLCTRTF